MLQPNIPLTEGKPRVVAVTRDEPLAIALQDGLLAADFDTSVHTQSIESVDEALPLRGAAVLILDIDGRPGDGLAALQRLVARVQPAACIVVTGSLNESLARALLEARIRDVLVKPVSPERLIEACTRALGDAPGPEEAEAEITAFLPATGGVGSTTLAIQAALLLQNPGGRRASTCLVDLDLQQGVCAEYLDLEPRLDLNEIEPRPERLDRQLLEVMLSRHSSGLSVLAAPGCPGTPVQVHPQAVSRLLDLVAANFEHVVIDLPRHWFTWTDGVLMGSNQLFVVAEMTVPALRQARRLAGVLAERLPQGPVPRIVVNRYESRNFGPGLRRSDIEQALGGFFAGTVANKYALVREAIDQGVPLSEIKPRNPVLEDIARLVMPGEQTYRPHLLSQWWGRVLAR